MAICKRCGACCHLYLDGKKIPCRFLVTLNNGKTLCRIYKRKERIGSVILNKDGKKYFCSSREKSTYDYMNCPYNTDREIIDDINGELLVYKKGEDEGLKDPTLL